MTPSLNSKLALYTNNRDGQTTIVLQVPNGPSVTAASEKEAWGLFYPALRAFRAVTPPAASA